MSATSNRQSFSAGFNFTDQIQELCRDITRRLPEMKHIDMDRVAVTYCQTRKKVHWGLYAKLTPMRFEGGNRIGTVRGRRYAAQQLLDEQGREMLYILSFYLPRFMDIDFREKLVTVFHELWHISPEFNGDIRRHAGRCFAHTHSQKQYDAEMEKLVNLWLKLSPPAECLSFLENDFRRLANNHGLIFGLRVTQPRLIPVA
jgi:predicted metallopeptidase